MAATAFEVRFLRGWQGRVVGSTCGTLPRGVMQTLVDNNIAEWVVEQPVIKRRRKRGDSERHVQSDD